jgi:prepilin-type processing-associated H-X9-DG protein
VEAPIDTNNKGVFFLNSRIMRDDLKDGAAYTLFLGEKFPDNFDLGWLSGTSATLRNTGSPFQLRMGAGWVGNPPWIFDHVSDQGRWSWDNQQVDPLTGELVTVEPPAEIAESNTASETDPDQNQPPGNEESGEGEADADASVTADPDGAAETDAALRPDKNGLLKHSKLGGNGAKPLLVGGFSARHLGGVSFAFGDGSVRFMADSVTAGLMGRLANREDGNLIDARELP